uniref:Carn_acyltransf domain-containing protein n=1 Tax=Steinernema glaseri TaxID=37863 RepID=A0A1I7ZGA8_9BILA
MLRVSTDQAVGHVVDRPAPWLGLNFKVLITDGRVLSARSTAASSVLSALADDVFALRRRRSAGRAS